MFTAVMDDYEIEILANGKQSEEVQSILQGFLEKHEKTFTFPTLSESNRRVLLWTALFQRLQDKGSSSIHSLCLAAVRLLSRDRIELENIMCEKWITVLIERAGLYNYEGSNVQEQATVATMDLYEKEVAVESLKCLCNLTYHSETARNLCAQTGIAQGLIARLRTYKDIPFKDDIMLFDMKLLFILTALNNEIKTKVKNELHGMDYLVNCLKELLSEVTSTESQMNEGVTVLNDNKLEIMCEILKAQFNLIMHSSSEDDESEEATYLKLMPVVTALLNVHATTETKTMLLHSNIANLLTSVPLKFYEYLTPPLIQGETTKNEYLGRNMEAIQALVRLLQYRLNLLQGIKDQYEHLSPILTVMIKCARGSREQRKYLRQQVLPPLRDVSRRPEEGDTLRNQLCRLLTTPVTSVRDLVAEFLFVLCKEKVGRMVKYTGFGNAAGHLAQKGLLGGGRGGRGGRGARYSSSEDSDTEEYLEAQPDIDPVVGCTRPHYPSPFEGMSEEQKEYEAMKLVNMFDKMVSAGVVKPARVGPDGRPQPVDHVLELRDHPNRPQS